MPLSLPTLLAFAACLALSFLLSGMEAGFFGLSRLRVRRLMRQGHRSAKLLHEYLENPEGFLWTILVGNTLANFVAVTLGAAWLFRWFRHEPWLFAASFLAAVLGFYSFFELLPKMLFRAHPNRLCLAMARPFRLAHLALRPLVGLMSGISVVLLRWTGGRLYTGRLFRSREELRRLLRETGRTLTTDEQAMISRVLDLQEVTVRQIAIPWPAVKTVSESACVGDVLGLAKQTGLTRFPVVRREHGRARVIGLVDSSALLYTPGLDAACPVSYFLRPVLYLEEDLRLEVALERLRRRGQRLAVVLALDGREAGVLALQDILQFLFGEVRT